ncbi:MAG: hypothetical protein D6737_15010 [Chloroflexi bacterium]|nr:MAG: hypothetical protein CUN54_05030 [Phototrophicales bacterium]RMF78369.1 MAG: hypothetical protein D6737_15010 [Chloroflexota bacterium]
MIRLTVLYNLPEGADEDEFLEWRLGPHQTSNESMPGVVLTNFARIDYQWTSENPNADAPYRFMTIVEWPDRAAFEAAFYNPEAQAKLKEDIKLIADPLFFVSEILTSS